DLPCALLHNGNSEVSVAGDGARRRLESAAVIANGEAESIALVLQVNRNARWAGVANRIGDRLLPDTNQVMHAAGCQRNLFSFHFQCGLDSLLHLIGRQRTSQSLRKDAGDFVSL